MSKKFVPICLRHHIMELSSDRALSPKRGGHGKRWQDDMAVDAALWLILAAMIGLVVSGCVLTAPHGGPRMVVATATIMALVTTS